MPFVVPLCRCRKIVDRLATFSSFWSTRSPREQNSRSLCAIWTGEVMFNRGCRLGNRSTGRQLRSNCNIPSSDSCFGTCLGFTQRSGRPRVAKAVGHSPVPICTSGGPFCRSEMGHCWFVSSFIVHHRVAFQSPLRRRHMPTT